MQDMTQPKTEAAFDGGRITSYGGLVWLADADSELGLCPEDGGARRTGGQDATCDGEGARPAPLGFIRLPSIVGEGCGS